MKLLSLLLLALLASAVLLRWQDHWPAKTVSTAGRVAEVRTAPSPLIGVGTVLVGHSFPLPLYHHGPIKHLYVEDGQHVRKGELLLKYYDYTFLMAPTAGIVTQFSTTAHTQHSGAAPGFFFTEIMPFRLQLTASAASNTLAVGQRVHIQSTQHPNQAVTGVLLGIDSANTVLLLDLRLLSVSHEPLPAQTRVRVSRLSVSGIAKGLSQVSSYK